MAKIAKKVKLSAGVRFEYDDVKKTAVEYGLAALSEAVVLELAIHGLSQKLGDSYSGITSIPAAIASVAAVWANLLAGKFNAGGNGGGLLAEAVARLKGITIAAAETKLSTATEEVIEGLKANAKVKAMITVIRGERAKAGAEAEGGFEF